MKNFQRLWLAIALQLAATLAWGQGVLRFVATEYPPYLGAAIPGGGAMEIVLREAMATSGYQVEVHYRPWARVLVEHRKFDGVLVLWPAEIKTMGLHHYMPVFRSRLGFFGRSDAALDVSSWRSIGQRKIGISRDYGYPAEFLNAGLTLQAHTDDITNLRMLDKGRLDLVALERTVGAYLLRTQMASKATPIVWLEPAFSELPLGWALSRSDAAADDVANQLRIGLAKLKKSGRLLAITRQFDVDGW